MTIRLLRPFNGMPTNAIVTLDTATEAALVASFGASTTLTGGTPWYPGKPFDALPAPAESMSAEYFGASPNASADTNAAAIQNALNARGTATLLTTGTYIVSDKFTSTVSLLVGPGVQLVTPSGRTIKTLSQFVKSFGGTTQGYRTVLFGDSMTDLYQQVIAPTSMIYNKATGELGIVAASHQQVTGWYVFFWNKNYPSLLKARRYQVTRRVSADALVINVGANLPDVPEGSLALGTSFIRLESIQNAETWFTWFQYVNGNRFNVVYNGGQSGDTTAQCLARLQEACLDYVPDVVFMQMPGINEVGLVDTDTIIANRNLLIDRILAQVPRLVLLTTTPVAAGEVRATVRMMQRVQQMNQALREYCYNKSNVLLVDSYGLIVDPADTTGLAKAALLQTSDRIHYSMRGGKAIADLAWNQVQSAFPTRSASLPTSTADNFVSSAVALSAVSRSANVITATSAGHGYFTGDIAKVFSATGASEALNEWVVVTRIDSNTVSFPSVGANGSITGTISLGSNNNLMSNPLLTGAGAPVGGGIVGNYATGLNAFLTGSPTCTGSLVARSDGYGQNQRSVLTATLAQDRVSVVTNITDILRHIKAGRTYVAEAEINITDVPGSNLSEIRFNLAFICDGVTTQTYALGGYAGGPTLDTNPGVLHVKTPPLVCPAFTAITQARIDATFRCSAAGTAVTIDIGRVAFREYDPMFQNVG